MFVVTSWKHDVWRHVNYKFRNSEWLSCFPDSK